MRKTTSLALLLLIVVPAGCRSVFEPANPFTHGRWEYSEIYAPLDYDVAWETINDNISEWVISEDDKKGGKIESEWRYLGGYRLKLEIRLDEEKNDSNQEGVKFGLRVLRQRPSEVWTPTRTNYKKWKWMDPDEKMQSMLWIRFDDELSRIARKNIEQSAPPEDAEE